MSRCIQRSFRRSALTLVELMVALTIVSILAAISLPTVKNTLRDQKLARAAGLLRSAIEEGRARSIAGGGGGVIIDRLGKDSIAQRCSSNRIRFATAPKPYTGDIALELALIGVNAGGTPDDFTDDTIALWFRSSALQLTRSASDLSSGTRFRTLINYGDEVLLGDAGLRFTIQTIDFGTATLRASDGLPAALFAAPNLPPTWVRVQVVANEQNLNMLRFRGTQSRFSIFRSPRPAIAMPIEMPQDTMIDLSVSGLGRYGNQFSPMAIEGNYLDVAIAPFNSVSVDYESVMILFGARGEVSRVLLTWSDGSQTDLPVIGDIHLLVGRGGEVKTAPEDQLEDTDPNPIADDADDGITPLLDQESIWVTIKSRTGEIVTSNWTDPTDDSTSLIATGNTAITDLDLRQQDRIQRTIGRVRASAVASSDIGTN
ncbi:pilus assembly FimT family protein [Neorhodopirellula pilleata]|uniref:Major pilin subunit n=1 Tax=Neorhodopirellula pilleata TaxID=2714738 RepID=A0A5C6A2K2_9BACT|nr:prepilin-type N-terminal cleavage/methylation domain-containing protein [Neorhodopirellula pilleata]TWT93666.1 hypothetical protein Pla100_41840 [Neorhodopirellula pilleata]